LQYRKLNLKAKFESGPSYLSFESIDPGAFNRVQAAQVESESRSRKQYITRQSQALSFRRFKLGFHRVNLHRRTT
jgi:hypothetical protein